MNLTRYESPLGSLLLAADQTGLTGLWFVGQKYFPSFSDGDFFENETPVLTEAKHWLSLYFSGKEPDFLPSLHPQGSSFRQAVWNVLLTIPRGQTMTYGEIARRLNVRSAQAVGGAVGHNPISILIPCHRVVGSDGSLTGYAGGLARKEWLLHLEGAR
ncbi:MAG: methylated-DNA--[protein]-cysteine S-methyltransferase [Candidatus Limiplasma sp.]|mgnify:FL=1|nr:methylated-DNA--[protein]-cysteine S-methyltransferase [Clostridiales bacterium]MDY3243435.1 methylated-DNA--[protein]-cysteine S-methyltransferase [Candidatus Limiplasma sp.]MDY4062230.1 methylated-DNA--[protein]-cysteine S-methyltransferase [Candidatus Limiplasma sp.]